MKKALRLTVTAALAVCVAALACACAPISSEAKGTPSAHVTREQWEAYFSDLDVSLENCEITYETSSTDTTYILGIKYTCTSVVKYEIVHADGLIYQSRSAHRTGAYGDVSLDDTDATVEFYVAPNPDDQFGNTLNRYWKNAGGEWSVDLITVGSLFDPLDALPSTDYDDYVYSEDRDGYVLLDDLDGENVVLKFDKNGRLVAVWQEETSVVTSLGGGVVTSLGGVRTVEQMNIVIEYGGQSLTLPEVPADDTGAETLSA